MSNDQNNSGGPASWHGVPESAIIIGEVRIVQYLSDDGAQRFTYAVRGNDGGTISSLQALGLIELAKMSMWQKGTFDV